MFLVDVVKRMKIKKKRKVAYMGENCINIETRDGEEVCVNPANIPPQYGVPRVSTSGVPRE